MPRIAAANIEEHIRLQTGRILDAARDLFSKKGYGYTDIGDIAKSIGLARNSIYRYYPSKDHILVAVMQRDMAPYLQEVEALSFRITDPVERIDAWLDLQIELATGPCQATMKMLGDMVEVPAESRQEISALHEPLRTVLESSAAAILKGSRRDEKVLSAMIYGMVQSAGALAMQNDNADAVKTELKKSVRRILENV
jgi:AcrR family transcriptional regulator